MRSIEIATCALVWIALTTACETAPPPAPPPPPPTGAESFSTDRAWAHLEALTAIGPRVSGTEGAGRARTYIREQLAELDLEVEEQRSTTEFEAEELDSIEVVNLVATLPGASSELFVLVAPYDTAYFESFPFVGANEGGSGAALLLELARVLAERPLEYTTRIAFLDGEAPLGRGGAGVEGRRFLGSSALAEALEEEGELASIRLLVAFNRVCDADLRIARDLASHRIYREEFFAAASRLGHEQAFPPTEPFDTPQESHLAFHGRGVRTVVAIVDPSFGGDEPPGIYARTEDDVVAHCAPESLETVGEVALETLEALGARLAKIDRFARSPLTPVEAREGPGFDEPVPAEQVSPAPEGSP